MKIAIVKLSALGDIIHAMVVLQFIKKQHPDILIDWIVEADFKEILINNLDINKIHTVNIKQAKRKKSLRLFFNELKKIRKLPKYDVVIDIQGLIKSALVARIIPSAKTFGFDKNSLRESAAAWFYTDTCKISYNENIIKRNIFIISCVLSITISHDDILNKQSFLGFDGQLLSDLTSDSKVNIAIIPGASFQSKVYPAAQYAQIAQALDANFIVLWGSELEKNMAKQIQKITPEVQIASKLTLNELKALIAQMSLVIGGDTGPTHMAWALNIPSITLFGPTPGSRNAYITSSNQTLESNSSVNPCKIDKNDFSIKTIKVSDIVKKAKKLLLFV